MIFSTAFGRRLRFTLGTWMALVSLLVSLPMLGFLLVVTWRLLDQQQQAKLASMERRAAVAAAGVGREVDATLSVLTALAVSNATRHGDMKELHEEAARIVAADRRLQAISVADAQGRQWLNTQRPFGSALPESKARSYEQPVFERGRRGVSPIVQGTLSGAWVVGMAVPVLMDGQVTFSLRAAVAPEAFRTVLLEQRWPEGWTAAVVDERMQVVARAVDHERFVGKPATESLQAFLRAGGLGVMRATTQNGVDVLAAAAPVPGTGWYVAVGQPRSALLAEVRDSLLFVFIGGLALVLLGVLASIHVVRHLARQMRRAALSGPAPGAHPVREFQTLATHLHEARRRAEQSAADLHDARHDTLTGLPGRAMFNEAAAALLAGCAGRPALGAALLYLDLDGFKAANDRLGHEAGDRILAAAADVLRVQVRAADVLGRLGGDEFAVAMQLPAEQLQAASADVAARIVAGIGALGDGLGCTVGMAFSDGREPLAALLDRADRAMLQAKREGKNRVRLAA